MHTVHVISTLPPDFDELVAVLCSLGASKADTIRRAKLATGDTSPERLRSALHS